MIRHAAAAVTDSATAKTGPDGGCANSVTLAGKTCYASFSVVQQPPPKTAGNETLAAPSSLPDGILWKHPQLSFNLRAAQWPHHFYLSLRNRDDVHSRDCFTLW